MSCDNFINVALFRLYCCKATATDFNAFALLRIIETKIFYVMFHKSELALVGLLFNTLCFLAYFVSRTEIHASPPCLPLIPGSHLQQIRLERLPGYNEQILSHRTHY